MAVQARVAARDSIAVERAERALQVQTGRHLRFSDTIGKGDFHYDLKFLWLSSTISTSDLYEMVLEVVTEIRTGVKLPQRPLAAVVPLTRRIGRRIS